MSLLNTPEVSIIIPCYNVEKFIKDCLESVINQTFKNIEIICINDGSTDSTPDIIKKYAKIDNRIITINQKNKGLSGARNSGINASCGKYLMFLDSDDWIDTDYVEKMHNAIKKNNCEIAVSTIIRKREHSQKFRVHYTEEKIYSTLDDKITICNIPNCCYVWNKLYKTDLVKKSLFKEGYHYEDMFWTPEILKNSGKLITVPNVSYYYRVNKNSIVKAKQTKQKQNSSYKAHKYIVKFFKENNLSLSKKHKNITKEIHYFLNFTIMKIKEYENKLNYYLFGFIPIHPKLYILSKKIFSISDIDCHKMIYFLGIQIRKRYRVSFNEIEIKEKGITENKRERKIILSLTSFPDRINSVCKTIKTLLNQTLKPDEIILWLADSQFPDKEKSLPDELLNLKQYGLTINWCKDTRSYKKLIPSLEKYPNDIIITFDDDIYYDNDIVENLYNAYLENPNCICANRIHRVDIKNNKIKTKKNSDLYWSRYNPSYKNTIIGCGGVLYPPNSLNKEVFNEAAFKKIVPTQDDIWFWAMAVLNKTKINPVMLYDMQIKNVENTQQFGLCKINNNSKKGIKGKDGFELILKYYPELKKIIKEE